ncbi:MAG: glycoside hydrolase family 97 protein [Tannerella sp.]|jgi:alpha-glucosidase|nr:glycoside hydrolase family 97 protein [Tannerella sp.]
MSISKFKLATVVAIMTVVPGFPVWSQTGDVVLKSPDGKLVIAFRTNESKLVYEVNVNDKQLLKPSALGLELQNSRVLGENVSIANTSFSEGEDNYKLITGRTSAVSEKYNAVVVEIVEQAGSRRTMNIEARAYNDAVAFRYIVPEQRALTEYRLKSEKTQFRLSKDAMTYSLVLPNFRSGYESEFHKVPATGLANQGGVASKYLVGLPLLMNVPGVAWMAISEADLEGNSAMYLCNPSGSWTGYWFDAVVAPSVTDPEVAVVGKLPHKTAWRIIMVAQEPAHFIEANTLTSLNPESRITDTSWITSGKSAWDWWNGSLNRKGESAYTTETMKYYVDFAAESGLEFMTIDAGWSGSDITQCRDNVNVPEVVQYANTKGIKVFIWLGGTNVWRQMDEAFPLYEKWGVAGMKIDFILRDDQAGIDFYYNVAKKAAEHHLMVDFHGCTKPWGLQRTYPNVVGFEAVLGMEGSKAGGRDDPGYQLTVPFTRMIGGLLDYTPGGFDNVKLEDFVSRMERPMVVGTRARQLAFYVVYESPFQMVSDWPETYRGDPSFEFIKKAPAASWDQTKVLNGYPGEYVTIARQKGSDWYLGAITNWDKRNYDVSLDFLDKGNYVAEIYADAPDSDNFPKKVVIKTVQVKSGGKLNVQLAPAGGLAVHFRKVK